MESHQRDHETFLVVSRYRRRRAKALLDFERHDDDELGFRKNDIITVSFEPHAKQNHLSCAVLRPVTTLEPFHQDDRKENIVGVSIYVLQQCDTKPFLFLSQIISQKDEHCWVGELNGLRGVCSLL